jgi:hypothetical protein
LLITATRRNELQVHCMIELYGQMPKYLYQSDLKTHKHFYVFKNACSSVFVFVARRDKDRGTRCDSGTDDTRGEAPGTTMGLRRKELV